MKIVLAYSGGLDTSVCIGWLKKKYHAEIVAYTSNVGQKEDPKALKRKALSTGACAFYYEDLREQFARDYILPSLFAGALYQGKYPLATALARPLIAQGCVAAAKKEKAGGLAHGCTGKGNDQVRFELTFRYMAPHLQVFAPVREWEFKSREEEIDFAAANNIPVPVTRKSPYSIDWNLWGISIECGILEDPLREVPEDAYQITTSPESAPAKPAYVSIDFERGVPVGLGEKKMGLVPLIETLNALGGRHGVGRIDMLEDRLVGIKSREIYEAPAAVILHGALRELERLVMMRDLFNFKQSLAQRYAEIVYYGQWFSQYRQALDAFFAASLVHTTGTVRMKLYKGSCTVAGRTSPNSLYSERLATYTAKDAFDHTAAKGFIEIFGLPSLLEGKRNQGK